MRKIIICKIALVACLFITTTNCSKKTFPTANVNYISSYDGTITMRTVGIGKNQEEAIADAEKNAFNVLFFRGLPESEQKTALIGSNETEEKSKNKNYFDKFYEGKRYQTFIMSSILTSDLVKHDGGKSISVDVKINLTALRKDLEQFNVIRKFGY